MKLKILIIILVIAAAAGALFLITRTDTDKTRTNADGKPTNTDSATLGSRTSEDGAEAKEAQTSLEILKAAQAQEGVFKHPTLGFSFRYPAGYTVGGFSADEAQTILVEPKNPALIASLPKGAGFQLYLTLFDEAEPLTPERIKADLPDLVISSPLKITVDGAAGIAFVSDNAAFGGSSREIWFTRAGFLYQISSVFDFSPYLEQMLGTWQWSD